MPEVSLEPLKLWLRGHRANRCAIRFALRDTVSEIQLKTDLLTQQNPKIGRGPNRAPFQNPLKIPKRTVSETQSKNRFADSAKPEPEPEQNQIELRFALRRTIYEIEPKTDLLTRQKPKNWQRVNILKDTY